VHGAEPGQAVELKIDSVPVTTPGCVVVSCCEARSPVDWWHEEDHGVNLEVADGQIVLGENWTAPVQPLIGCLATAPAREYYYYFLGRLANSVAHFSRPCLRGLADRGAPVAHFSCGCCP
jgi:hypothetical protein